MGRVLLRICGPIAIHSYGLMIGIAVLIFLFMVEHDERFNRLKLSHVFQNIFIVGLLSGIIGGRLLYVMRSSDAFSHWTQWFALWEPGLSVLGCIIAILTIVPWYLKRLKIPVLPFLDLIATYAGFLQGFSRLGCFFAGCCFGLQTTVPWSVTYTDVESIAPLNIPLHPSQLYSAIMLFFVFIFMYFVGRRVFTIPGQQTAAYLMLAGLERFLTDFWRGDTQIAGKGFILNFSFHQSIALILIGLAGIFFVLITMLENRNQSKNI